MKWRLSSIFFLLTLINLSGQCDYQFTSEGPPGIVHSDSFQVVPGTIVQIDYCSYNVPDRLIIDIPGGELNFIIGNGIDLNQSPPSYHGFCKFEFNGIGLNLIDNQKTQNPSDIGCFIMAENPGGTMRLIYQVPEGQCQFKWTVIGHLSQSTIYHICISIKSWGDILQTDTVHYNTCVERSPHTNLKDCILTLFVPDYWGIETEVNVTNSKCLGDFTGKIEFAEYPNFNQYGLDSGYYHILVDDGNCQKEFDFYLEPERVCRGYAPNIFNPDHDQFIFYTKIEIDYHLNIYSRWGELLFSENCRSNVSGWNGSNFQPGVFIYQINVFGETISGDVTLIR